MQPPNPDLTSLQEAIEPFEAIPEHKRADLAARLDREGWSCSKKGVWHSPEGLTLAGYINFVAERDAPHLLTDKPQSKSLRLPSNRVPVGESRRTQLMQQLHQANGCEPDYGF